MVEQDRDRSEFSRNPLHRLRYLTFVRRICRGESRPEALAAEAGGDGFALALREIDNPDRCALPSEKLGGCETTSPCPAADKRNFSMQSTGHLLLQLS
ncbi:hypothetical protein EME01_22070 [Sinorhizobium meliloti]|nr:hypothetical protein EME01_22070 [Sinorhizobium meliloti]